VRATLQAEYVALLYPLILQYRQKPFAFQYKAVAYHFLLIRRKQSQALPNQLLS
jgi:hypothetical protein